MEDAAYVLFNNIFINEYKEDEIREYINLVNEKLGDYNSYNWRDIESIKELQWSELILTLETFQIFINRWVIGEESVSKLNKLRQFLQLKMLIYNSNKFIEYLNDKMCKALEFITSGKAKYASTFTKLEANKKLTDEIITSSTRICDRIEHEGILYSTYSCLNDTDSNVIHLVDREGTNVEHNRIYF